MAYRITNTFMVTKHKKTTEQWVEIIAKQELPAITSTAKMLDKFANDDVSSLTKLSEFILHDQALSSCLLRVANSIPHFGVTKVTTVSRAAVMLGIHTVKNICLTSKLIDSLLKSKNLTPAVYRQLTQLMATSFYAGILAKMMVPNYNEDTQEEVYLAAMLYRIGETAFWSSGGNLTDQLLSQQKQHNKTIEETCHELLGIDFNELTKGLASTWNLGDLLVKALDQPESRTIEIQTIFLANKLSQFIQYPPKSYHEFNQLLAQISEIMQISVIQLREKIHQARSQAVKLLNSYGAQALSQCINPLPTLENFTTEQETQSPETLSPEQLQLNTIKALTQLTKTSKDFNEFLQLTLKALVTNMQLDRCTFLMLTTDKKQIKSRFSFNKQARLETVNIRLPVDDEHSAIAYIIQQDKPALINNLKQSYWRDYIDEPVEKFINKGAICIAPVKINDNPIGVISGHLFTRNSQISEDNFAQFCFLIDHLNMCLTVISRH